MELEIHSSTQLLCPALTFLLPMTMPVNNFFKKAHNVCLELSCTPVWLSQVPDWAISTVDQLFAHEVMADCALKLRTVFNDIQRAFNDFSIHQLQYNLSCWQLVEPMVTHFSMHFFSWILYFWHMCQHV